MENRKPIYRLLLLQLITGRRHWVLPEESHRLTTMDDNHTCTLIVFEGYYTRSLFTGTHLLTAIIDASWKVNGLYASGRLLRMRDPLHQPLDSKYHMFCFLVIKQSRVCKISVRFDLQKFPMLFLFLHNNFPVATSLFQTVN